ncbi:MAG: hypothetical protein COX65_02500 [Elusimicrobia bacterium CG_4_10_14_0_2_um_filter_56_8]|nr:MAG: hypothetical protein AUJ51_07230 [Elusimicrobia bacterium CG1_02_56_21]PJA16465.1 MAG: hypothetical protein COX65_02500 [Elusimicrobia bacterium CG_4_10_14_0_2_um_filter_56_8]
MKSNLVLIQPGIGDMDMFRDNPTPPLGLLCAASLICGELEVRIVDQRAEADWRAALAAAIDKGTVAVGFTAMTGGMILNALEAAVLARSLCAAPLVWGGIHASLLPEQTVSHDLADYVVEGEGEQALAELVRRLAAGADTAGIPGVWSRKEGKVFSSPRGPLLDLDTLPPVPYHLVDMEKYTQTYRGKRMFFYQSSRGCPCKCAYCYNRVFSLGRLRAKSAARVLAELRDLRSRYDFSLVYLLDDNFFIDQRRAMTILAGLKEMGLGCVLQGVDIETLARMSDADLDFAEAAGVVRIAIGVESGVDRVRTEILNKSGSLRLAREQLARFKNRKIAVLCSLIVGLPAETPEEIRTTMSFGLEILRLGENFRIPQFYIFSPYPGTKLFSALERAGTSFPGRLEEWGKYEWDYSHMHESSPGLKDFLERACFVSKFLDRKMDDYGSGGWILKALYNAYRPLARFRLRTGFLNPLPERAGYAALKNIFKRSV